MKVLFIIFAAALIFSSCSHSHSKSEIEASMQQYDSLLKSMNADAISKMFTPDGKLGDVAEGRDSIRKFLLQFTDMKVLSQSSDTKSIELKGDSATQTGMYHQTTIVDGRDTVHLKGTYETKWKWMNGEGWRIEKITTQPIK